MVNYYIPVVHNFDNHWSIVSSQFPLYVSMLYLVSELSGLSPHHTVLIFAVSFFGIFAVSLFVLSKYVFKLNLIQCIFLTVFVLFQISVLRTAWDLHRDIFALSTMLFSFFFLSKIESKNNFMWKDLSLVIVFSLVTVSSDRMIGGLLCISLFIYGLLRKRRIVIIAALLISMVFAVEIMVIGNSIAPAINSVVNTPTITQSNDKSYYNSTNLFALFILINGLNISTGIFGYLSMKNNWLLKIPLLITTALSFTWILFPEKEALVADRWTILSGIFVSFFSAYGLITIEARIKTLIVVNLSIKNRHRVVSFAIYSLILIIPVTMGLSFEVMPYDTPFVLFDVSRNYTEHFVPVTMQFNSMDIKDNVHLLNAISWINHNTEKDSTIVGDKHWRGLMEMHLQDNRSYRYSDIPVADFIKNLIREDKFSSSTYVIDIAKSQDNTLWLDNVYSNALFSTYKIR